MKRRQFLQVAAASGILGVSLVRPTLGQGDVDASGGIDRYAVIGFDVLGTADRYNNPSKRRGFSLLLRSVRPPNLQSYDTSVFVQRFNGSTWVDVPSRVQAYRSGIDGESVVDYSIINAESATVSFFIPHEVLDLSAGEVQLRFRARIFTPRINGKYAVDPAYDREFAEFQATVHTAPVRNITRGIHYGGINLPVQVWDTLDDHAVNFEEAL